MVEVRLRSRRMGLASLRLSGIIAGRYRISGRFKGRNTRKAGSAGLFYYVPYASMAMGPVTLKEQRPLCSRLRPILHRAVNNYTVVVKQHPAALNEGGPRPKESGAERTAAQTIYHMSGEARTERIVTAKDTVLRLAADNVTYPNATRADVADLTGLQPQGTAGSQATVINNGFREAAPDSTVNIVYATPRPDEQLARAGAGQNASDRSAAGLSEKEGSIRFSALAGRSNLPPGERYNTGTGAHPRRGNMERGPVMKIAAPILVHRVATAQAPMGGILKKQAFGQASVPDPTGARGTPSAPAAIRREAERHDRTREESLVHRRASEVVEADTMRIQKMPVISGEEVSAGKAAGSPAPAGKPASPAGQAGVEALADRVYELLERKIRIERERRGM